MGWDLVTKYGGGLPLGRVGKAVDKSSSFLLSLEDLFIPKAKWVRAQSVSRT